MRNSTTICEASSRLIERISRTSSMPDGLSSMIFVTSRSTTSAGAPRWMMETDITGGSMSGYSRTGSTRAAPRPIAMSSRLPQAASTGRVTERSRKLRVG